MDKMAERYFQLKQEMRAIEQELAALRSGIIAYCGERELTEAATEHYRVKLIAQKRREYDDAKLYRALPDTAMWRLLSKADPSKISNLLQLNVLQEETLQDTYSEKKITLLQVEKV